MLNTKMQELGENRSVIRDLFEYGKKRKKEIGEDKVFDFSLGNPCVPAPDPVNETIYDLLDSQDDVYLHGYTSAQGDLLTRRTIAADLNRRFGTSFQADNLYMTCGAAASLKISLTALIVPDAGDEVLTFAPYFPEYRVFAETAGAVFRFIPTDPETFQIRIPELEKLVGENTKAVIINSPNNPSGVNWSMTAAPLFPIFRTITLIRWYAIPTANRSPFRENESATSWFRTKRQIPKQCTRPCAAQAGHWAMSAPPA